MKYVFDPEVLIKSAAAGIGQPHPQLFDSIRHELEQHYPGKIDNGDRWLFNNAGGAMGLLNILYASLSEYLIFFGSPTGTAGHSGRYHFVEDFAIVIDGEFWYADERQTTRTVYRPGQVCRLPRGEIRHYRIPENGWILEYARGYIPTMLPFGMIEILTSTMDWRLAARTVAEYSRHVIGNLTR